MLGPGAARESKFRVPDAARERMARSAGTAVFCGTAEVTQGLRDWAKTATDIYISTAWPGTAH